MQAAYDYVAFSIAAYEASPEVNAFTSKFDTAKLSKEEQRGYALFRGKGKCAKCHIANGQKPLFTDYTFDNLGVPKNPDNPVYDIIPISWTRAWVISWQQGRITPPMPLRTWASTRCRRCEMWAKDFRL